MQKKLKEDLKPGLIKREPNLGIVKVKLNEKSTLKAIGVVFGIEHTIIGDGFEANLFLDQHNQRIKILSYKSSNFENMILQIRWIAEANGFDKIICMAPRKDWQSFLKCGYVLEAVIKYYLKGEDAYVMSKFRSQERLTSESLMEEILLIEEIVKNPIINSSSSYSLDHNYIFRSAKKSDIPELILLYKEIFESYPSPLCHESYFEQIFDKDAIFVVVEYKNQIISAASAELNPEYLSAELTDCATKGQFRGMGLMTSILLELEKILIAKGYICSYTMARSRSYGMNNVFYQLNYEFFGRLVNNCDIFGAYEDMNIWVKDLRIC